MVGTEGEDNMATPESDAIQVVRDWYTEWCKFPKYLATASLAFLAFSFTELLAESKMGLGYLFTAWILLGGSAFLSFIGMLGAYASFDVWNRRFLRETIEPLGIKHPEERTRWIRRWGKISYRSTFLAAVLLLVATGFLGLHFWDSFKAEKPNNGLQRSAPCGRAR